MATIMKLRQCQPSACQLSTFWPTQLQGDWRGSTHSVISDNPFLTYHKEVPQVRHLPLDLGTARHTASHVTGRGASAPDRLGHTHERPFRCPPVAREAK